jgi:transketolase
VVADISPAGAIDKFRTEFPQRFINVGVREQSMIGIAAGMCLRGLRPFCYTIATFSVFRPFEFLRDDLAYQGLPVTVVGIAGGVSYSTLGGTHHAMEDVAVLACIPEMSILAPCDPLETASCTSWCVGNIDSPIYLRLGRAGELNLTRDAVEPFQFGHLRYIRKGTDVAVISYGPILSTAANIADTFEQRDGLSVSLISCHTLKPIDAEGLGWMLLNHKRVIVIEESVPYLGPIIKTIALDERITGCWIETFALNDRFYHKHGPGNAQLSAHGLTYDGIAKRLK